MKGNVIRLNIMHLNSVQMNSIGEVQSVSLKAGESTEDPVYPPTTYTLAANVSNGKVTATKNGTAISLPYVATEGDVIVLSVTPDEGYEFKGWLDGNKSNPRTVTMTGNVVLSASCVEIAKPTYTLSASVTNGKVSAKRNGSAVNLPYTANEGDVIVVEVTPNDGYSFEGWADGNTDNPRSITMTADVVLSAECVEVVQPSKYIQFEDKAVEAICVANWSSDGIGLTEEDAAKVTDIANKFAKNSSITSFNELVYFVGLTAIGGNYADWTYGFKGCTNLKSVVLPKSVTTLKHGAFDGCTSLESVGDLSHITTTQTRVFYNCSSLAIEVNMPNLNNLGGATFYGSGIKKVVSLGNTTALPFDYERGCFRGCTALTFVELSEKMTSIAAYSFYGCTALETFICRATTPPSLTNANAFTSTNNCPIYVPDASLEAYKTAVNWSAYADRIHPLSEIEGDNGVIKYDGLVGAYTFKGRSNEDADYDLVQDRSGNGNIMTLTAPFGTTDSVTGDIVGYNNDLLYLVGGYGKMTIPQLAETNNLTIIAKRTIYSPQGVNEYSAFFGAEQNSSANAAWLDYREGQTFISRNTKGQYVGRDTTEIVWMTPKYMNGHILEETEEMQMNGTCYLGRLRTNVSFCARLQVECLYVFNRELSPSEVESFIKAHIDADYVLPTIEQ